MRAKWLLVLPIIINAQMLYCWVGSWVTYWKPISTHVMILDQLHNLNHISPFSLELTDSGTVFDPFKKNMVRSAFWDTLIHRCSCIGLEVMPTIASFNKNDLVWLSNNQKRQNMIKVLCCIAQKFSGLIINFEQLSQELTPSYMDFIQELSVALKLIHKKLASCILASCRNSKLLKHVAVHCDYLFVMCYNQWLFQGAKNRTRGYFVSCAPLHWVETVLKRIIQFAPKQKIIMCLPLYGTEFELINTKASLIKKKRSINYHHACAEARKYTSAIQRSNGCELYYSYQLGLSHRYVCFTDHVYIIEALKLEEKFKLKGTCLFAIDGYEDQAMMRKVCKGQRISPALE